MNLYLRALDLLQEHFQPEEDKPEMSLQAALNHCLTRIWWKSFPHLLAGITEVLTCPTLFLGDAEHQALTSTGDLLYAAFSYWLPFFRLFQSPSCISFLLVLKYLNSKSASPKVQIKIAPLLLLSCPNHQYIWLDFLNNILLAFNFAVPAKFFNLSH